MDIFEEITYDKTAWAEQKKAQRDAVFAKIDEYLDTAAMDPAALQTYLDVQAQFPLCSVSNAVLIAAQRPEATEYHTFDDWKKKEVSVNKGEQSFSMLVPNGTYTGKDGKTHTSFDVQKVFDISQTSAEVVQRNNNLSTQRYVKRIHRIFSILTLLAALFIPTALAADPITTINNLSTFIFGLIKAVGIILVAWGVVQVGLSIQSHDASQRSQGFLTLAGGIVIFFAQEILTTIGVA